MKMYFLIGSIIGLVCAAFFLFWWPLLVYSWKYWNG